MHGRDSEGDPCDFLFFHMLKDVYMFGGLFYCRAYIFGGTIAHVVAFLHLGHSSTYFDALFSIGECFWGVFIVIKAWVTYLEAFLNTKMSFHKVQDIFYIFGGNIDPLAHSTSKIAHIYNNFQGNKVEIAHPYSKHKFLKKRNTLHMMAWNKKEGPYLEDAYIWEKFMAYLMWKHGPRHKK